MKTTFQIDHFGKSLIRLFQVKVFDDASPTEIKSVFRMWAMILDETNGWQFRCINWFLEEKSTEVDRKTSSFVDRDSRI